MTDSHFVNLTKKARKLRHQKLFGTKWDRFFSTARKLWNFSKRKKGHFEEKTLNININYLNPVLFSHFHLKLSAVFIAVFLASTILPTYAYEFENDYLSDNHEYYLDENIVGFQEKKITTTEDGFLVNTAGQTEIGDRSNIAETTVYEVKPGDNISSIAQKFHISIQTIAWNNNIVNINKLKPAQKLTILPVDGVLHTIKEKETVKKIASKYKVKAKNIIKQNKLEDETLIAGKNLIIPGGKYVSSPRLIAANNTYVNTNYSKKSKANIGGIIRDNSYKANNFKNSVVRLIKPCGGRYTQYYHRGHYAVDIANRNKGPIYAAASGKIVKASYGWNGGYGNLIIIDHGGGIKTLYAHNEALYVKVGDVVSQGQTVGWMGNTGRVYGRTGIHLHFEVIINGVKKNPLAYIR